MGGMSTPLQILVVDDNPDVLKMLDEILGLQGHRVVACDDGQTAIDTFNQQSFDIVITDLGMPEVNGWDIVQAVRDKSVDLPIFVITAIGEYVDSEKVRELDVQAVIRKPFRIAEINTLIQEYTSQID